MSASDPLLPSKNNTTPATSIDDVRPGFETVYAYTGIKNYSMLRNRFIITVGSIIVLLMLIFGTCNIVFHVRKGYIESNPSAMPTIGSQLSDVGSDDSTAPPTAAPTPSTAPTAMTSSHHPTTFMYWNDVVHAPTSPPMPTQSPYFDIEDNPLNNPFPTGSVRSGDHSVPWPTATGARESVTPVPTATRAPTTALQDRSSTIPWPTAVGARSDDSTQT